MMLKFQKVKIIAKKRDH